MITSAQFTLLFNRLDLKAEDVALDAFFLPPPGPPPSPDAIRRGADRIREIIQGDRIRRGESDALKAFYGRKFNELAKQGKSLKEIEAISGLDNQIVASWQRLVDCSLNNSTNCFSTTGCVSCGARRRGVGDERTQTF
jgi:hypothetical protein